MGIVEHSEHVGTLPDKRYLIFAVTVLMLVSTLRAADRELLAPLYDPISRELGINDLQFGMIRSTANLAMLLGGIFFGLLADRYRRRDVVAIGVLCWSLITWMTGRVVNFSQLLLARFSMTFFEGAGYAAYPMLGDMVPRRGRGVVMGILGATFAVGTVVALLIAALVGTKNWRAPWIYFGLPGVILGLLILFFLREPARGASEDEIMGTETIYAGKFDWQSLKSTLRIRTALLTYLLDGCQGATWWAFAFWAPAYLLRMGIAHNSDQAALALLPAILGFVVGTLLGGLMIDRLRRLTQLSTIWVALVSMSGALVMSVVVFALRDLTAVLLAGFFLGLFGYMIMPVINVLLFDVVPPETRASALAADGIVMGVFSILNSFAIGAISHYLGIIQGLPQGNLLAGFQGTTTVLLAGGVIISLVLLRVAPADMAALRHYVAERAIK